MTQSRTDDPISALPWNSQFYGVPTEIKKVPTMLTDEEGRMLRWVSEFDFTGAGTICELGSFVGGSTARLAFGLSKNKRATGKIHAFDRFECAESMKADLLYSKGIEAFSGLDILPISKRLLAKYSDLVVFHKKDVNQTIWDGGPIELLFVDIAKTADTADHIAKQFYRHLIPGRSVVIHQDYFHHQNPWNVVQMELLSERFTLVGYAQNNSAVFRLTAPIEDRDIASCSWNSVNPDDRIKLVIRAMRRFPHLRQREMLARVAMTISEAPNATKASEFPKRPVSQHELSPWLLRAKSG